MVMRDKVKVQKIGDYLAEQIKTNKTLAATVNNLGLYDVYAEKFKEKFGEMSPEEMGKFILDLNNCYEVGKWAYEQNDTKKSWGEKPKGDRVDYDQGVNDPEDLEYLASRFLEEHPEDGNR